VTEQSLVLSSQVSKKYKALGYKPGTSSALVIQERIKRIAVKEKQSMAKKQLYREQNWRFQMGVKNNGLQKHYKNQLGFST
jgi:hypothetical protein